MDSFNKLISFVLGLVVVVVFFAVVSGRINLRRTFPTISKTRSTPTPTPNSQKKPNILPSPIDTIKIPETFKNSTDQYQQKTQTTKPKTIPQTGSPTTNLILGLLTGSLGFYLRLIKPRKS